MPPTLSNQTPETYCHLGEMVFRYRLLGGGAVEFTPLPGGMEGDCREFPQRVPFHPALPEADTLQSWNGLEPDRLTQIAVRGMIQTSVFDLEMAGGASKFKSSKIVGSFHGTSFILTLICSLRVKRSRK